MRPADLVGMRVIVMVSDPWDFVTAVGPGPFKGTLLRVGHDYWAPDKTAAILRLEAAFTYEGVECRYFVAAPRHVGSELAALARGADVICSFTRIPEAQANSDDPFNLSWWRGGVGLIGSLQRA